MRNPLTTKPPSEGGPRRGLGRMSFNRLLPNIVTLLALCAGLTAMRYGAQDRFQPAVGALIIAGILDGLDGRLARRLNATSRFGAELDSLADFLSFGVAPAFLLYNWTMKDAGPIGWALVLLFSVCCALRLARFNTGLDANTAPPSWMAGFFTGVPAPAGAGLVLLPLMISFETSASFFSHPAVVGAFLAAVGALMVSRIPTFSFKRGRIEARYVLPVMILIAAVAGLLATSPWITLPFLGVVYVSTFPFSLRAAYAARRAAANDDRGAAASAATVSAAPDIAAEPPAPDQRIQGP
jgi:CDP-diacylglycerol--serine O-phosphatidyltransferase